MSDWTNTIQTGDCFDVLDELPAESVHAVVTDPPYGLAFMGRDWDDFEPREYQEWCERWAREAKRVLKPGGHLLAFSGNRTHHRLFSGVEDSGYEVRDTLTYHYGSGFPKALDVSKQLDKEKYKLENDIEAFADYLQERRENKGLSKAEIDRRLGTNTAYSWWEGRSDGIQLPDWEHYGRLKEILDLDDRFDGLMAKEAANRPSTGEVKRSGIGQAFDDGEWGSGTEEVEVTAPATDAAKTWDGWKTALKPATEFIVLARKPLSEGTVAENVQTHGTGALNIDGCRVEHEAGGWTRKGPKDDITGGSYGEQGNNETYIPQGGITSGAETGRYPSNVVFDEQAAERLDREVGELSSGELTAKMNNNADSDPFETTHGEFDRKGQSKDYEANSGGPSRYFYTSKATKSERTLDGRIANAHPTVKPQDLMEWLVRLVTREGQTVLDLFAGSGTTCKAAKDLGREFVGIEKQPKWADVARARIGLTPEDPARVRSDDAQEGLEAFTDGGGSE